MHKRAQQVADYFAAHPWLHHSIRIRGGEETYRCLIASDLSWRALDIIQGQTLRWLVEVFMQDWKSHEGWSQATQEQHSAQVTPLP